MVTTPKGVNLWFNGFAIQPADVLERALQPTLCFVVVDDKNWLLVPTEAVHWYFTMWPVFTCEGRLVNGAIFPEGARVFKGTNTDIEVPPLFLPFGLWHDALMFKDDKHGSIAALVCGAMKNPGWPYGELIVVMQSSELIPQAGLIPGFDATLAQECYDRKQLAGMLKTAAAAAAPAYHARIAMYFLKQVQEFSVFELVPSHVMRKEFVYSEYGGRVGAGVPAVQPWNGFPS